MAHPESLNKTILSFRISMIINIIAAVILFAILLFYLISFLFFSPDQYKINPTDMVFTIVLFGGLTFFKASMAIFRAIIIDKLKRGLKWSHTVAIILNILMLPPFFGIPFLSTVLGAISLWGLFDEKTTVYFEPQTKTS